MQEMVTITNVAARVRSAIQPIASAMTTVRMPATGTNRNGVYPAAMPRWARRSPSA